MLQIIIDRKNKLISTRKYSSEEHWNAKEQLVSKDHPDAEIINLLLKTLKAKIAFLFIANGELDDKIITFDDIKKIIIKYTGAQKITGSKKLFEVFDCEKLLIPIIKSIKIKMVIYCLIDSGLFQNKNGMQF